MEKRGVTTAEVIDEEQELMEKSAAYFNVKSSTVGDTMCVNVTMIPKYIAPSTFNETKNSPLAKT